MLLFMKLLKLSYLGHCYKFLLQRTTSGHYISDFSDIELKECDFKCIAYFFFLSFKEILI
jgi:hypothetical protein